MIMYFNRIRKLLVSGVLIAGVLLSACSNGQDVSTGSLVESEVNQTSGIDYIESDSPTESDTLQNNTDTNNHENKAESDSSSDKEQKQIVLTVWDYTDNSALAQAVSDYKKTNPNVTIKVEQHGKPSADELKSVVDQKIAPDIVNMDQVYNTSLGIEGYFVDLNQYGAKKETSKFIRSATDSLSHDGKLYGFPFDANTICFYYNKTMLKQSGAKVPSNYNELIDAAKKVKTKYGSNANAYTLPVLNAENPNWSAFNYFFYLWRMGGEILTSDFKKAAFNQEAGVEALEKMVELEKQGLLPLEYKESEFLNGQVAMIDNGSWQVNTLFGKDKKADFGAALLPQLKKGVKQYSGLGVTGMAIPKSSQYKREAYEFMRFYCTGKDYQLSYCKANNLIPTLKSAQKDSYYQSDVWKVLIKQSELSKYRPGVKNWDKIELIIAEAVSMAMNGIVTPKEALDAAAKSVNELLR